MIQPASLIAINIGAFITLCEHTSNVIAVTVCVDPKTVDIVAAHYVEPGLRMAVAIFRKRSEAVQHIAVPAQIIDNRIKLIFKGLRFQFPSVIKP